MAVSTDPELVARILAGYESEPWIAALKKSLIDMQGVECQDGLWFIEDWLIIEKIVSSCPLCHLLLTPKAPTQKNAPKTSAKPTVSNKRDNLMLHNWMTVFAYIDAHTSMSQTQIWDHFALKKDGALEFSQSALSRKLKVRDKLEPCVHNNPVAMSSKHARVVTRPDMEKALFLWVKHMEAKGESVSGPMLKEKRKRYEEAFEVPDDEHLLSDGWISSFCRTYKIKEHRRHGEAGSVDLAAVEVERARVQKVLAPYALREL
ncbi:hypothetical protein H0H87_009793 [Tephrocybe sp. NHM501043]|nr:hypothetical protein H0H87_009793 [Tephrocybe sp. NHM501043]